ncbi:MAG: hypothetical protein RIQ33_262 [Bacteroidota bacterium]|jgi:ELWxxDGT repeat protein
MKKIIPLFLLIVSCFNVFAINGSKPLLVKDNLFEIMDATEFNGKIYFKAIYKNGSSGGDGLFVTEGTSATTKLVYPLMATSGSVSFQVFNNRLYFTCQNYTGFYLRWINAQSNTIDSVAIKSTATCLTELNNKLYFIGDTQKVSNYFLHQLYETDGTTNGTNEICYLSSFIAQGTGTKLIKFKNKIVFQGSNKINENQLWVTDGTRLGTKQLTNISYNFNCPQSFNFSFIHEYKNRLYFNSTDSVNGSELFFIDSTFSEPILLKNIFSGDDCFHLNKLVIASQFHTFNNEMYFFGIDTLLGSQLWKTDGTVGGTKFVKKIVQIGAKDNTIYNTSVHISSTSKALFLSPMVNDTIIGNELIIMNNNNFEFCDLVSGKYGLNPNTFFSFHDKMYFIGNSGWSGINLWVSDGTLNGTKIIEETNLGTKFYMYGPSTSGVEKDPRFFTYNGSLYFEAREEGLNFGLYKLEDTIVSSQQKSTLSNEELRCYPNPTKDFVVVEFNLNEAQNCNIEVTDVNGKTVLTNEFTGVAGLNSKKILFQNLSKGIYFVRLISSEKHQTKKLEIFK